MRTFALTLAVLFLTVPSTRAEDGAPRLRLSALEGRLLVHPPEALTYPLTGPVAPGGLEIAPGTIIEAVSGEASFESDLHARIVAPAGSMFRVSTAEPEGRRGLRVSGVPDAGPLTVEAAGAKLTLWAGGRVAVYDGGRIEVESAGVLLAPGSVLREGESITAALTPGRFSMVPGDSISLNLPLERGFKEPQVAAAAAPERPHRRRKAPGPVVARAPKEFEDKDAAMRDAVAAGPAAPMAPRALETPPLALEPMPEGGMPRYDALRERWPFSRDQTLGFAALACMALLAVIEGISRKHPQG